MKSVRLRFLTAVWAFPLLCLAGTAYSLGATPKPPPPPPVDTRILIKSVNAAGGTIVIKTMRYGTLRTYKLDSVSTIEVNKVPGKITDIKPGMQVRDSVERDDQTLDSIAVGKADPKPVAPK